MQSRALNLRPSNLRIAVLTTRVVGMEMPLIDHTLWRSRDIQLKDLHFHPSNPRLPELPPDASNREIIHEMCRRFKVDVLAKQIADKGYLKNDRLIVVRVDGKNVVFEGNRRLCALFLLAKPDLAPAEMLSMFKKQASKTNITRSFKVAVEVVPSQFDAEVVMYSKHSPNQFVLGWDRIQQSTFIAAKLESGDSIEDLISNYGLRREEVIEARAAVDFYRICRLAPLSEKAREMVVNPTTFPYSTVFERLVKPKGSREALGISISDAGLTVRSTPEVFLPVVAKIMEDAANDRINTRLLNDTDRQLNYVNRLKFKPGGGNFGPDDLEKGSKTPKGRKSPSGSSPQKARQSKPSGKLLPGSVVVEHECAKLHRMVKEAKDMKIEGYPHAAVALLRMIIEIALVVRLKQQREHGKIPAKNSQWGPSLSEMLDHVNKNPKILGLDASGQNALGALTSRKVKDSKPQIDRIVHLPEILAIEDEVVAIREAAFPLLLEILRKKK